MAAPESRRRPAPWWAAGLLGAALTTVEIASFRLDAAVFGWAFARLAAAVVPALGGLFAAIWTARRTTTVDGSGSLGTAAYGAGLAAAGCGASAIALTWGSQRFAKLDGSLAAWLVPLLAWTLVAVGGAVGMSALLRAEPARIGRHLFAFGLGSGVGALLLPVLSGFGFARIVLACGLLLSVASWALVRATSVRLQLSVLATVPLALLALSLGDIRNPWLKLRLDVGRKGRVGTTAWTANGLLQIDQGKSGIVNYTVDRAAPRPLSLADTARRRQAFELPDVAYFLNGARGPALVVGAGGGREIREAIDAGHGRVDAIEPSLGLPRLVARELAAESGYLFHASDRVSIRAGEVRAVLADLGESYERIVVVGDPALEPTSSRALSDVERTRSVEAIRDYLSHLAGSRGVLLLRAPRSELATLLASATTAAGVDSLADRAVACAERKDDGHVALLVMASAPGRLELQGVEKSCRRKGLVVEFPTPEARHGDRDREAKESERERQSAALAGGRVVRDDRPFVEGGLDGRSLRTAARESLRSLVSKQPQKPDAPRATGLGVASSGAALTWVVALLVLVVPVARGAGGRLPVTLRAAVPFLGLGTGVALVAIDDLAMRLLGGTDALWAVAVPTSAVALGAGRLFVDAVDEPTTRRCLLATAAVAVVACGLAAFLAAKLGGPLPSSGARLGGGFAVLVLVLGAVGAPFAMALRLAARTTSAGAGWTFGAHLTTVAAGVASSQVVAHFTGISRALWIAGALLGVAGLLASAGGLGRRPSSG